MLIATLYFGYAEISAGYGIVPASPWNPEFRLYGSRKEVGRGVEAGDSNQWAWVIGRAALTYSPWVGWWIGGRVAWGWYLAATGIAARIDYSTTA